jgi:tRNA-splicing endonuclease subunit Sen2
VVEREDMDILFRRGFFGKGTLSRSEPSWRERRIDLVKGGSCTSLGLCSTRSWYVALAAEQFREKRRQERKQFKIDRAAAMLDAAKMAEEVLVTGQAPPTAGQDEEEEVVEGRSSSPTPSTSTVATTAVDVSHLTPQTYLVRPTRPDANRNRGRNAFKRRPPPPPAVAAPGADLGTPQVADGPSTSTAIQPTSRKAETTNDVDDEVDALPEVDEFDDSIIEEMEHLQLSLEEAWFLSSALGVLKIYDPATVSSFSLHITKLTE